VAAWNRFWFEPTPTSTLALVRIALGVLVIAWTLSLAGDLFAFFGREGIQPSAPRAPGSWGVLALGGDELVLGGLYAALLVAAIALTAGFHTRVASVVVFVGLLSLERRSPFVFNAGDHLLRILAFYVMLAPAGAALSIDRLRSGGSLWEFPERAPWALRLIQLQLSVVYVAAAWAKVRGTTWNDGTAVSYALRLTDLERFPVPAFLTQVPELAALLTYGTVAIELSLGLLVWNRRLRPWVLSLGLLLHLGIEWSLRVGFFSLAVLVMYIAFVPPGRASEAIGSARRRLRAGRRRLSSRRRSLGDSVGAGSRR
jgi:Vitamin K-dependent gamma-carboxylase